MLDAQFRNDVQSRANWRALCAAIAAGRSDSIDDIATAKTVRSLTSRGWPHVPVLNALDQQRWTLTTEALAQEVAVANREEVLCEVA